MKVHVSPAIIPPYVDPRWDADCHRIRDNDGSLHYHNITPASTRSHWYTSFLRGSFRVVLVRKVKP